MKRSIYPRQMAISVGLLLAVFQALPAGAFPLSPKASHVAGETMQHKQTSPHLVKIRMAPREVRQELQDRGFREIEFLDRHLPRYVVRACDRHGERVRLNINRNARIRKRVVVGRCRGRHLTDDSDRDYFRDGHRHHEPVHAIRPREVRAMLRARGFNNIRFEDRELPEYVAVACRNNKKRRLTINRRGRIIDRERLGRCYVPGRFGHGPAVDLSDIKEALRQQGYRRIHFTDRRLPKYEATACRRGRKFNLVLNRFGDIKRRTREGWCERRGRIVEMAPATPLPRIEFDDEEIMGRDRIDGARCQNFLEYTLDRRKIYFDTASARIRPDSYRLLNRLAHVLGRCPSAKLEIAGHTDSRGSHAYNQELSEARAISVTRYLYDKGVSKSRMIPIGYGEERPVASNQTEEGLARNRRIEFVVDWDEEDDDFAGRRP